MNLGKSIYEATHKSRNLHACPICSGLGEKSQTEISDMATEMTFEAGQFLMHEGEACEGFFLVLSGKVRVYKAYSNGKEKVLLVAEKGMTFGEDGLFGPGTFQEMAMAITKTRVLHIDRQHFLKMLRHNPDLSLQVMESLCMWSRRLATSVESVAFLTARDKAARYLLEIAEKNDSNLISLPIKKKEIADQLGLAPETLSRAFHDFADQKIISIYRREVSILNLEKLKEVSHL